MIATYTRRSLLFGVPGIVLQVGGVLLHELHGSKPIAPGETRVVIGPSLVTFGVILWTAALAYFAMAKGQSSWWGASGLLGLPGLYEPYLTALSLLGLIVLALLEDRAADSAGPESSHSPGEDSGTW
jgi:hypothetical protein